MKDKTLLNIPNTVEIVCFPMAFLSSQCRYLQKDLNGKIIEIIESKGEPRPSYIKNSRPNIFIPCPLELMQLSNSLPSFWYENQICQFNCYRLHLNLLSPIQLQLWIQLCQYIHHYVEMKLNRSVDMNDLQDSCTAYAGSI